MKAMILAAGVGSRLRPLTDRLPKALVEVGGAPLIAIVLRRLAAAGVREVVINTFHHADVLERFLRSQEWGLEIAISRETELLDTGGGLLRAAPHLVGPDPFFVHNADVVSGVDLRALLATHRASGALATLAVRDRAAARRFLFDDHTALRGWENAATGERLWAAGPVEPVTPLAFDGIQVVSPRIFDRLTESGVFSLTPAYLRLAGVGERILGARTDASYWADVGSMAKLDAVRSHVAAHGLPA